MLLLALSNLFYDKIRLVVTLTGVVFAILLASLQIGLLVSFTISASNIIDNSKSDLWITSKKIKFLEMGEPISESNFYQVQALPGVDRAEKIVYSPTFWKKSAGGREEIALAGIDPDSRLSGPWNIVAGSIDDLRLNDTIMIDVLYQEKLGVSAIGDTVEINGRRARVVGFTKNIRTFTTVPLVFTSFKNGQNYANMNADKTTFVMVKAAPQVDEETLKQTLKTHLQDVEVLTKSEFSNMTREYWMLSTGAGSALISTAILGLIVGLVVVAQTIYGSTVEYIREYGTLKAIGASNAYLYNLIITQAVIISILGYAIGMGISLVIAHSSRDEGIAVIIPWQISAAMFALAVIMCVSASLLSVNKVIRLDPAIVFKS